MDEACDIYCAILATPRVYIGMRARALPLR